MQNISSIHILKAEIQLEIHQRNHQTIMAEKDSCIAMLKHSLSTVESVSLCSNLEKYLLLSRRWRNRLTSNSVPGTLTRRRFVSDTTIRGNYCATWNSLTIFFLLRFIDEFEKQKLLGIGGYGCVFQARNRLDKCDYAVKRIPVQNGYG